jgi:RND family efflux transporter MFP subunit
MNEHPLAPGPSRSKRRVQALALALVTAALLGAAALAADDKAAPNGVPAPKPALTVTVAVPQSGRWPMTVSANGSIAAWQEAVIGAEAQGLRLTELRVQVGDRVKRGQWLALLAADTLAADAAAARAGLAEAEANQAEAAANAERARQLQASGAISAQQIQQYTTAEATAKARAASLRAQVKAAEVRLAHTRIVAPDDGVISARSATLGAVVQPGQELFRLIRKERLEWRAEVAASDLARIRAGQRVTVTPAGAQAIAGTVRMVAPTVDAATRNGVVYVDLAKSDTARAGMFARGDFAVGEREGMTLPQGAVVLRDGFAWVFQLGNDNRVQQRKVSVGARIGSDAGDRVEITAGLDKGARVVASGAGFLADGDVVRVAPAQ